MPSNTSLSPYRGAAVEEWYVPSALATRDRLCARKNALETLNPMVRRVVGLVLGPTPSGSIDLTIYEAIYQAAPEIGGHWTVSSLGIGLFIHTLSSYAISLAFDAEDRPSHFVVNGRSVTRTPDTSETALIQALELAGRTGPERTTVPHLFRGVAL
jgi:hypothetical protein